MNPIYKFQLSAGNDTRQAFPVYKDDLAIDYALEQNQEFYRGKLSGKLTFQKDDYLFIRSKAFDTQFDIVISISYDNGQTWSAYWSGQFWKTDCEFDEDTGIATVTPTVNDRYNTVLAGMEKEFDLISLAPQIVPVKVDKRPMIQVYVPGQTVIGCFLSGMWWEQECESVTNENELIYDYYFAKNKTMRVADVSGTTTPQLPNVFTKINPSGKTDTLVGGNYAIVIEDYSLEPEMQGGSWSIINQQTGDVLWYYETAAVFPEFPYSVTLQPQTGASGTVTLYIHNIDVYARYICDVLSAHGVQTYELPANDLVNNNRNYTRVIPYNFPNTIGFSTRLSSTPTKWGLYQPGSYYLPPESLLYPSWFPVARKAWGLVSIWFTFNDFDFDAEKEWRMPTMLRDSYPIASVISVLLGKISPNVTHQENTDYSVFLYGPNPLTMVTQRIIITPKSNMISLGYDQPAQKAPITLKTVLDMLRDCFRCYWFIDNQNRFRIEHISYFMNGGAYPGTPDFPTIGINLTEQIVTRNGKPWSFARNQYQFDKPEMAARYQFGWMDDVTELFNGFPIDILSNYVNPDKIEQIDVSKFTSDVDYILLNPSDISKDGFVLLAALPIFYENTEEAFANFDYANYIDGPFKAGDKVKIKFIGDGIFQDDRAVVVADSIALGPITENNEIEFVLQADAQRIGIVNVNVSVISSGNVTLYVSSQNYELPYQQYSVNNTEYALQNAWASFMFLQQYYMYDMPARDVEINGVQQVVQGIKKLKTQTIKFPVLTEPNLTNLIKTELGNGVIQKMSVNLSSRNANTTLKYDTE